MLITAVVLYVIAVAATTLVHRMLRNRGMKVYGRKTVLVLHSMWFMVLFLYPDTWTFITIIYSFMQLSSLYTVFRGLKA